jgi:formylglycine-generating enzyme required for sulfatase activity
MRFLFSVFFSMASLCAAQFAQETNAAKATKAPKLPKVKGFKTINSVDVKVAKRMVVYAWDSAGAAYFNAIDTAGGMKNLIEMPDIEPFGMSETEVSNKEWWEFVFAAVDANIKGRSTGNRVEDLAKLLQLDTCTSCTTLIGIWIANQGRNNIEFEGVQVLPSYSCWMDDFPKGQMKPMSEYYFAHKAYENFPVVGISHEQAEAYCSWRSKQLKSSQWKYALPSEKQFIAAAMNIPKNNKRLKGYAPYLPFTRNSKGMFLLNYNAATDQIGPNNHMSSDGHMLTAPVYSYFPNQNGLYNLHGNVAEWTCTPMLSDAQKFIIKGGSFMDPQPCVWALSYTALPKYKGDSRVGFRMVMVQN